MVASSAAIDHLRRRKPAEMDLAAVPEDRLAVEPRLPVRIRIPAGLLSPRQALVKSRTHFRRDDTEIGG